MASDADIAEKDHLWMGTTHRRLPRWKKQASVIFRNK